MAREIVLLGEKGQITIPKRLREKYGFEVRSPVILEETPQGLLLKPSVAVEVRIFSREEVEEWVKEDQLRGEEEREEILRKWR